MADATALIQNLILVPGRFGSANIWTMPKDGIEGSEHHNVESALQYRVGTICQLWHPGAVGQAGWSEFVYGRADTAASTVLALAQGHICLPNATTDMFDFTNDSEDTADEVTALYAVVCISSMTDNYYGWWWSGGVCPCDFVSGFTATSTYVTDDSVDSGGMALEVVDATTAPKMGLGIGDGTKPTVATSTVSE